MGLSHFYVGFEIKTPAEVDKIGLFIELRKRDNPKWTITEAAIGKGGNKNLAVL